MPANSLGADLARASTRDFVTLSGYPNPNEESEWHVNKVVKIGTGVGDETRPYILQAADASEHWLVIILKEHGSEWHVDSIADFEGSAPKDLDSLDSESQIDPQSLSILEINNERQS